MSSMSEYCLTLTSSSGVRTPASPSLPGEPSCCSAAEPERSVSHPSMSIQSLERIKVFSVSLFSLRAVVPSGLS